MMRVPMMVISLARAFVGGLAPLAPTATRGMRSQTRRGGRRAAPYSDVAEACAALGRRAAELTRANTSPDLVVVPTSLGEPADLTVRAIAALAAADVVACEDTRVAGLLYEAAGIERKAAFVRHDAATAAATAPGLVEAMLRGETVALVSDAGTPAVSDPGALLVRAARDAGLAVRALPGPCAATTALSASGFGNGLTFSFLGFVEGRGASAARRRALRSALDAAVEGPAVLYESPRRVRQTLLDLDKLDGGASQRLVLIARELTKTHEETWRGALGDAVAYLDAGGGGAAAPGEPPRGEFTLVLDAKPKQAGSAEDAKARVAELRASGLSASDAAKAAASELGLKKSEVYRLALDAGEE